MAKHHKIQKDTRNGTYFARIQINGTRRYFTLGSRLKDARRKLTRLEKGGSCAEPSAALPVSVAHVPSGTPNAPASGRDPLLSELIDAHLRWVKANRAPRTLELYDDYEPAFLDLTGDIRVSEVTRMMLEEFFVWAKVHHSKSSNGGISFLRHIKTMFLWAEEMDICPCPVRKFPTLTESPPHTQRFTDDELRKLLSTVPAVFSDFRDMIVFGLQTGLRPQELRGLTPSQLQDIGHGNYTVLIHNHKTAKSMHEPRPRSVPLTTAAKTIALRHISAHPDAEFVFLNAHGGAYTKDAFRQRLRRWCTRAGIKPRPPYALRHTFGSMEAEANVNQTVIAQMMGHNQLSTTSRYISNNADHHRHAIAAINSRITRLTPERSTT